MRPRRSEEDPGLRAVVTRARPMRYRRGADPSQDRPAQVRAGSGLTWWRGHLAVVQDDTAIVPLVEPGCSRRSQIRCRGSTRCSRAFVRS